MIPKDNHWVNTLTGLFNKTRKGSKTFRKVLGSKSLVKIDFNREKWIKLLRTNRICESEIQAGYRNMQTRLFPRQLLDLKIRLLLGKTQFGKTLAKWSSQEVSQGCKVCLRQGHFEYDDLGHRLLYCPRSISIIDHIRSKLTKQKYITPVHIIFTNTRCTHQIMAYGDGNKNPVKKHTPCSFFNTSLSKNLAATFVWDEFIKYMMDCSNNDCEPSPKEAIKYICREIVNFVKFMPMNPVCLELDQMFKNMDI